MQARFRREWTYYFLAGSCPINKDREVDLINDYTGQAKLCVENLKEALIEWVLHWKMLHIQEF